MKSKTINYLLVLTAVSSLVACNPDLKSKDEDAVVQNEESIQKYLSANNLSATRDSSGMYYVLRETNPAGTRAGLGDEVSLYYRLYTMDNFLLDSTETAAKKPFVFPLGVNFHLPGVEQAISLLRTGDKATLLLPFYLAFSNIDYPSLPAYSAIRVELEVAKVRTETTQVADYVEQKEYTISEKTASGISIVRQNVVTGDTIGAGKSVKVKYSGKQLNGVEFDKGEFSLITGSGSAIKGFDEGIRRLRKGEKAVIIFPSSLGYGRQGVSNQQGAYTIRPYAPLAFEVEVLVE
jgi:FKBP-type peptidyl-prolyl cis-trans isomerase